MGDKKGQGSPDGVTNAADAPTSASTDDFCPAFEKVQDASVSFESAKSSIQEFKDVGTTQGTSESQRNGFEKFVGLVEDSESQSDYAPGPSDLSVCASAYVSPFLSLGLPRSPLQFHR